MRNCFYFKDVLSAGEAQGNWQIVSDNPGVQKNIKLGFWVTTGEGKPTTVPDRSRRKVENWKRLGRGETRVTF